MSEENDDLDDHVICNDCGKEIKQEEVVLFEYDIICSICKAKRDQYKLKNNYCPDCGNEIHQSEAECRVCKQLKEKEEKLDDLDDQIAEIFLVEEKELLREEIERRNQDGWIYRYQCPYCAYQNSFFHNITIHLIENKRCRKRNEVDPCYPILIHQPRGAPIP